MEAGGSYRMVTARLPHGYRTAADEKPGEHRAVERQPYAKRTGRCRWGREKAWLKELVAGDGYHPVIARLLHGYRTVTAQQAARKGTY